MTMSRTQLLMSRILGRGAQLDPNEEVVTLMPNGTHRQTLKATWQRANQVAGALSAMGIQEGDRVGSFMWNNYRHLELYQAVPSMGAVLHTLNIRLGAADLEYIINHAGDRVIFADEDLLPLLEPLLDKMPTVEKIIICRHGEGGETSFGETEDYEAFIQDQPTQYAWPDIDEHAPMGLCYTSGTTGKPKGVMYTHRSTYLHTINQAMTDSMNLSALDAVCGIVPMFHAMGWGVPFTASMLGCKQVMPHRFMDPERLLQLMCDEEVTLSAGVPTIWQGVKTVLENNPGKYDTQLLARLTCGGSAPPVSMMRWYWQEHGIEMIQGWGMTETNPLGTLSRKVAKRSHLTLSEDQQFDNIAKAGLASPGLEIEIFDENWETLPHDGEAVGELLIRGPWICSEYYNDPQPDKFHDGWLVTGDVAKIDQEEYLIIADRSKDLIKSGGEWISSVDLENHIVALPGVRQAAVVAQPHPKWDERPVALVILLEGANVTKDLILDHCAEIFAKWQLPDDVIFVHEIPLTSTGKIDKKVIRSQLESEDYLLPDLRSAS
ncbi:MAG TPA: long-chain fatty acid--CoA ligase [Gammaproteobacteria bacterium]|jgi:acyl-CoA synthetase (AMP-forming)/AMP-acid ligase II|nr:long-chain fatty acid--CoA ligase [Gammaproteobacteria bacterium]MDA8535139.1 long-chain fatty acid--CoA ligase [Pseudomonadales bacterium]MDA8911884.1 long-chain fatty acid--CoA ligase [Pseudomonadales bacterium]MDA9281471.1 long-chain fatty acid--CoA ligase [Pseudomonadales bacterium]MDB2706221.1 long-chain fatty acid--CoA ligase [Pseudomonadales bacterium]